MARRGSTILSKKLFLLTIAGGAAFWVTTIATSLLPIAAEYRAAFSNWHIQTVWVNSLFVGMIVRRPLLAYFVLSYTFFWGFLVLISVILGMLRLQPDALPAWAMPIIVILGSWMPNLAAVTVTGVLSGREGIKATTRQILCISNSRSMVFGCAVPFSIGFCCGWSISVYGGSRSWEYGFISGFLGWLDYSQSVARCDR